MAIMRTAGMGMEKLLSDECGDEIMGWEKSMGMEWKGKKSWGWGGDCTIYFTVSTLYIRGSLLGNQA